jgi:hypothetical protein
MDVKAVVSLLDDFLRGMEAVGYKVFTVPDGVGKVKCSAIAGPDILLHGPECGGVHTYMVGVRTALEPEPGQCGMDLFRWTLAGLETFKIGLHKLVPEFTTTCDNDERMLLQVLLAAYDTGCRMRIWTPSFECDACRPILSDFQDGLRELLRGLKGGSDADTADTADKQKKWFLWFLHVLVAVRLGDLPMHLGFSFLFSEVQKLWPVVYRESRFVALISLLRKHLDSLPGVASPVFLKWFSHFFLENECVSPSTLGFLVCPPTLMWPVDVVSALGSLLLTEERCSHEPMLEFFDGRQGHGGHDPVVIRKMHLLELCAHVLCALRWTDDSSSDFLGSYDGAHWPPVVRLDRRIIMGCVQRIVKWWSANLGAMPMAYRLQVCRLLQNEDFPLQPDISLEGMVVVAEGVLAGLLAVLGMVQVFATTFSLCGRMVLSTDTERCLRACFRSLNGSDQVPLCLGTVLNNLLQYMTLQGVECASLVLHVCCPRLSEPSAVTQSVSTVSKLIGGCMWALTYLEVLRVCGEASSGGGDETGSMSVSDPSAIVRYVSGSTTCPAADTKTNGDGAGAFTGCAGAGDHSGCAGVGAATAATEAAAALARNRTRCSFTDTCFPQGCAWVLIELLGACNGYLRWTTPKAGFESTGYMWESGIVEEGVVALRKDITSQLWFVDEEDLGTSFKQVCRIVLRIASGGNRLFRVREGDGKLSGGVAPFRSLILAGGYNNIGVNIDEVSFMAQIPEGAPHEVIFDVIAKHILQLFGVHSSPTDWVRTSAKCVVPSVLLGVPCEGYPWTVGPHVWQNLCKWLDREDHNVLRRFSVARLLLTDSLFKTKVWQIIIKDQMYEWEFLCQVLFTQCDLDIRKVYDMLFADCTLESASASVSAGAGAGAGASAEAWATFVGWCLDWWQLCLDHTFVQRSLVAVAEFDPASIMAHPVAHKLARELGREVLWPLEVWGSSGMLDFLALHPQWMMWLHKKYSMGHRKLQDAVAVSDTVSDTVSNDMQEMFCRKLRFVFQASIDAC